MLNGRVFENNAQTTLIMSIKHSKKEQQPLITYVAKEISTGKVIVEGDNFSEVNSIAEETGKNYKIVYRPNPNLSFVF